MPLVTVKNPINTTQALGDVAIFAGGKAHLGNLLANKTFASATPDLLANFLVTDEGYLYAQNAHIEGYI